MCNSNNLFNFAQNFMIMKKQVFLMASILIMTCVLSSCGKTDPVDPQLPEERMDPEPMEVPNAVNLQTCTDVVLRYFPYSAEETLTFQNDKTNEIWKITPQYNPERQETFPSIESYDNYQMGTEWYLCITAWFMREGKVFPEEKRCAGVICIVNPKTLQGDIISVIWKNSVSLTANTDDTYTNRLDFQYDTTLLFTQHFTDTITLPMAKLDTTLPSTACMHIVRGWGITDFSLDGESVWRRKKTL